MPTAPPRQSIMNEIVHTELANGQAVCIRTIRPTDEALMRKGIEQLSANSRYFRFFSNRRIPADDVIEKLLQVDGHQHLAWAAILTNGTEHRAIGAVHVFRDCTRGAAGEYSVAILDDYHGMGLARMLTAVLLVHCRLKKISSLDVQILSENSAALNLVRSLGGQRSSIPSRVAEFTLATDLALLRLQAQSQQKGVQDVFAQLASYL